MLKFFSDSFLKGLKRQALIKALDLLIDALIDFKQNYASKSLMDLQNKDVNPKQSVSDSLTNHL